MIAPVTTTARVPLQGGMSLSLSRPVVMGVLNVTPDSFSDGGRYLDPQAAFVQAQRMQEEGVALLDVGGESTRPGAAVVSAEEELARVLPVLERVRELSLPISIDTRKAVVARAALAAGAHLVNDISGLADPNMAVAVAEFGAGLIVGHIQGTPSTMQADPSYRDVVAEVEAFLLEARERALLAGIQAEAILLDPGIGFGKSQEHNLALLGHLDRLAAWGPVVVGLSRKSLLGQLLEGRPAEGRLAGGLGGAVWAALRGASVIRTHDVLATVDALRVVEAIRDQVRRDHVGLD